MRLEPFTLTGTYVQLEPLTRDHGPALLAAGNRDRSSYGYTPVPATTEEMGGYLDWLLADAARDAVVPFVQRRLADDTPVGCTRSTSPGTKVATVRPKWRSAAPGWPPMHNAAR